MKRLILAVVFILGASCMSFGQGCSSTAYTGFTCVSHAGGFTTATSRNQTISVTSGDAVVFSAQVLATGSTLTVTDSGACTGNISTYGGSIGLTSSVAIFVTTKATSTGTCTMTATWGGSSNVIVTSAWDWQGWNGAFDVGGNRASVTGQTNNNCPAATTTQNGDLVLCMMFDTGNNGGAYTAGTGFAITLGNNSGSQEAKVQSTAGAITPQFTYAQSSTFGVATVTLESSAIPPPASNALSAWNGIVPAGGVGGLNRINGQYINPSTGFLGSINGAATPFSALPVTEFANMSGGTNGVSPTPTTLTNSTFGTAGFTWGTSGIAAGMTYSNAQSFPALPEPVLAGGTAYGSPGTLTMHCASANDGAGTAHSCGSAGLTPPSPGSTMSGGFWYTTPNCNAFGSQDCGAMGILTGGTDYLNIHVNGTGGNCSGNGLFLESHGGNSSACLPFTLGATYRINGQENTGHAAVTVTFSNGSAVISGTNSLAANQAVKLTTSGTLPTNFNVQLSTGSLTSGVTATGAIGTYCVLSSFNGGGSGATALVYLIGTNTIGTGGTNGGLSFTNLGSGYTSAPTSATASNGTATCSGSAVVSTVLATPILFVSSTGLSGSQFELAAAQSGTPIVAGSAGSGTHTATQYDVVTICQVINSNLVLLGTLFALADTTAQQSTILQTGVSGEGPTVTGYDFYWGGFDVDTSGKISLTECIL
jgi:hypothetical protein